MVRGFGLVAAIGLSVGAMACSGGVEGGSGAEGTGNVESSLRTPSQVCELYCARVAECGLGVGSCYTDCASVVRLPNVKYDDGTSLAACFAGQACAVLATDGLTTCTEVARGVHPVEPSIDVSGFATDGTPTGVTPPNGNTPSTHNHAME